MDAQTTFPPSPKVLRPSIIMGHTSSITVKNDTDITLNFQLSNLVPYYWGTVKPGESATRYTGSWWFTVEVRPAKPAEVAKELARRSSLAIANALTPSSSGQGANASALVRNLISTDWSKIGDDSDAATPYWAKVMYGPNQEVIPVDIGTMKACHKNTMGIFAGKEPTVTVSGGFIPSDRRRVVTFDQ